ncbi:MAG TPA: outer membrane beta-barrel protein, partial [Candidatus Dojkabacteria bacterium]|nr:outer membrane beta-barrel protein [Candidatus Dojkabacteria bacterium]
TPDNYFYTLNKYSFDNEILYREKSENHSGNTEYTLQSDYILPFTRYGKRDTADFNLEMGIKAILRNIKSDIAVDVSPDGQQEFVPDPSKSNNFAYLQQVFSSYASLRFLTKRRLSLSSGLRLEHTNIHGEFLMTGSRFS